MRRSFSLTQLANSASLGFTHWLDRALGSRMRRQPADYSIDLDDLYRVEGHWALTFSRLGTVHFSPPMLQRLRACLDARSFLRLLWRFRRSVDSKTIHLIETFADAPSVGRPIRVSDDYYGRSVDGGFAYYPYAMHPWVYAIGYHRRVVALRRTSRRFRLFFAGVVNDGYGDRFDFPILSRPAIMQCVLDTFRSDACVVSSRSDLAALRRTDRPIILILFQGDVTPMASNHFLSRPTYLRMLARSEFALCPPGVFMPHSHNLVEAMAVGTVPITNYPQFCRPPLIDGQTCLAFHTPDDLSATIRRAIAASPPEIQPLRAAVTQYYDTELSPTGTARQLISFLNQAGPDHRLILNREFNTARMWSQARSQIP